MGRFSKLRGIYTGAALLLLNTLVFLIVANAGLYVVFRIKDSWTRRQAANSVTRVHRNPSLRTVYPGMNAGDIDQLIRETWSRPYHYEPYTQFKERPYRGRFVNVSEAGYRLSGNQSPWPPDGERYNVFVFGGSTTFGYGLPDSQTTATYLQEDLDRVVPGGVCVYNFSRGSYVSGQERALFEQLLMQGHVPDLALFIDGLNEFAFPEGPAETPRLEAVFGRQPHPLDQLPALEALPMTRLGHFLRRTARRLLGGPAEAPPSDFEPTVILNDSRYDDPQVITRVIDRYFENVRLTEAVARAHGVRAVFVWQPIPLYRYDLRYHLFATGDFGTNLFARHGYRYMEERIRETPPGRNFLWCADMQESLEEPLYVDKVHYTARMSRLFARTICDQLAARRLIE